MYLDTSFLKPISHINFKNDMKYFTDLNLALPYKNCLQTIKNMVRNREDKTSFYKN